MRVPGAVNLVLNPNKLVGGCAMLAFSDSCNLNWPMRSSSRPLEAEVAVSWIHLKWDVSLKISMRALC